MRQRQGNPFLLLTLFSAATLAGMLLLIARADRLRDRTTEKKGPAAEIAVEHDDATTLTILQSSGKNDGIVELSGAGDDMLISVPSEWERREVRGAELSAVTADDPSFAAEETAEGRTDMGFTRWHVPAGVTLSFHVRGSPALAIRHPSQSPLLVVAKRVDVRTGEVREKNVLIKERGARLW